jgi:hypothetical protein
MTAGTGKTMLWYVLALLGLATATAHAEPYLAVQQGLKCEQCHVNPTGGGMRTAFGNLFAQTLLPARHLDTGNDSWMGQISRYISAGGDVRFDGSDEYVPHSRSVEGFALEQARVYLAATVVPNRFTVYVDEQVAPGGALNREVYGLYWSATHDWYLKAGQMYLPFGLRLQDQSAFVLTTSGINMTTPDQGAEVGWEGGPWDIQLAVSNGTAGGAVHSDGKQWSGQFSFVQPVWRLGLAANDNDQSAGAKTAYAIFGGVRTGPIAWLAQAEITDDQSIAAGQGKMLATLVEADWRIVRGSNLKITDEFLNPNRAVPNGEEARWSLVYEFTPIQYLQLRTGIRYYDGIPQDASEHERLYFVEAHGFF